MSMHFYDPDIVKFLVIRFSSIGDIVLTTPAVRCLKRQVEDAEVHYLTKKQFYPILKSNPYIDKVYVLGENNYSDLIDELKEEHYHYIIDLHKNLRTFILKNRLRIISFSLNKLNWKKWLLVHFKINKLPAVHIVDRYMKTLDIFDVKNDNRGLDYFIEKKDEVNVKKLDAELRKGFIVLVVGGKHTTKQIPVDKMILLCDGLKSPVILLGGEEDHKDAAHILQSTKNKNVHNICGKYSINQSASIIKQSECVITPDTGLMHIAAAYNKKVIAIWGNTIPQFGMSAYHAHPASKDFEVQGLNCRPCSKIGYSKCPKKHFKCMNSIPYHEIINYVNSIS